MTECDEVAESIWRARSSLEGNALNVTQPMRTYADAEWTARHYCGDQGETIIANVAESLWLRSQSQRRAS